MGGILDIFSVPQKETDSLEGGILMANHEHLTLLKQGPSVWNQWRLEHPEVHPDLAQADLQGANLVGFFCRRLTCPGQTSAMPIFS